MATAPKKAYGILHIISSKFLHSFEEDHEPKIIKFPTKEIADFYLSSITRPGIRIKHDAKVTPVLLKHLNIEEDAEFENAEKKLHMHFNSLLNNKTAEQFIESCIKMQKFCETIDCIVLPDSVIYATFDTSEMGSDGGYYNAAYEAFPDFNPCCELYEKSHFEPVEVPNKVDVPFIVNQETTAKLLLKLFSQAKNGGISPELIEKLKKEVDIKSVTVT